MSLLNFSQCRRLGCNLAKWCRLYSSPQHIYDKITNCRSSDFSSSHLDDFGILVIFSSSATFNPNPILQVPILQRAFRHGLHRMHGLWHSHHRRQQRWPHGVREAGAGRPGRRGGRLAHGAGDEEAQGGAGHGTRHTVRWVGKKCDGNLSMLM